jgi:hypothetical protein
VEYEGEALGRDEGIEHDQQRRAHRVGKDHLLLGGGELGCLTHHRRLTHQAASM